MRALRVAAAAALLAALHGAAWFYAAGRVADEVQASLDALRAQGWAIAADAPRRGGWPWAAEALFSSVEMDGAAAGVPAAWRAGMVGIGVSAVHPATLQIIPTGAQQIRLGAGGWVPVTTGSLSLDADADGAVLSGTSLVIGPAEAAAKADAVEVRVKGLEVRAALTGAGYGPFALPPANLRLAAALTRPVSDAATPADAAAAWRDGGGAIQIHALMLESAELHAFASGTGWLDIQLQPALSMTAEVRGFRPALDRLARAGLLSVSAATAAKAVLGLLAGRGPDDPAAVTVKLTDGVLAAAGFPLLRLPQLDWAALPGQ